MAAAETAAWQTAPASVASASASAADTRPALKSTADEGAKGASSFKASELVPGMATGAFQVVMGHPFDTVKTRSQAAKDAGGRSARITSAEAASALYREAGVRGFYRGALPPVVVNGAKRGMQLAIWERITPMLGGNSFVSGAVVGALGTVVGCPLHVVKIWAQTSPQAVTSTAAARDIVATGGLRALYRGFFTHQFRDACFSGAYLGSYGYLRERMPENIPARTSVCGVLASLATWVALQPLDTYKTLAQLGLTPAEVVRRILFHRGAAAGDVADGTRARQVIWRSWRGVGAALMRAGPVNALAMVVYEQSRTAVDDFERRRA